MNEREIVEWLRDVFQNDGLPQIPVHARLTEATDAIERLSGDLTAALKRCADYAQEAGEWKGRYEAAGYPGTLDGWIARAEKAERERDEAVERLKDALDCFAVMTDVFKIADRLVRERAA